MRIKVIPVGAVEDKFIQVVTKKLNSELNHRFIKGKTIKIPEKAYDKYKEQYRSEVILDALREKGILLALTNEDIYADKLNFVFGQAEYRGPCIVGLARLKPEFYGGEPNFELLRARLIKECIHEIGHVFGLDHCKNPKCVMSYSNNIKAVDKKGKEFCKDCQVEISSQGIEL